MATIEISEAVRVNELNAVEVFLRNRLLIQGQAIEHLKADLAAKDEELIAVKTAAHEEIEAMRMQLHEIESRMAASVMEGDVE